jgi:hypothetical protein
MGWNDGKAMRRPLIIIFIFIFIFSACPDTGRIDFLLPVAERVFLLDGCLNLKLNGLGSESIEE